MTAVRALVVGYGSIGARHARLLAEAGCDVAVVSSRAVDVPQHHATLAAGWAGHRPDHVVVANDTSAHHDTLCELAALGHAGTVLVEKPVFDRRRALPAHDFADLRVAYNLRFHPVLQRLRGELQGQRLLALQVQAGQYLPGWRPGTDWRRCYSADVSRGGGVLLDLSHDLDYVGWLAGPWRRVAAIGGHLSSLEITSDDIFGLLYETERCPCVSVHLDYLDRAGRRRVHVQTDAHTYDADLVRGTLRIDGDELAFPIERDITYRAMHQALLGTGRDTACALPEALDVLALTEAARAAVAAGQWITR